MLCFPVLPCLRAMPPPDKMLGGNSVDWLGRRAKGESGIRWKVEDNGLDELVREVTEGRGFHSWHNIIARPQYYGLLKFER